MHGEGWGSVELMNLYLLDAETWLYSITRFPVRMVCKTKRAYGKTVYNTEVGVELCRVHKDFTLFMQEIYRETGKVNEFAYNSFVIDCVFPAG